MDEWSAIEFQPERILGDEFRDPATTTRQIGYYYVFTKPCDR
jgi:hypothetical protein